MKYFDKDNCFLIRKQLIFENIVVRLKSKDRFAARIKKKD